MCALKLVRYEKKSPIWYIRGTYLKQRVFRSSGTAEKAVAQRELLKIKHEIESGRYSVGKGPTVDDAFAAYLKAGGERKFARPLLDHFRGVLLDRVDQAAVDEAAHALYPNASPATHNRQVFTPLLAVLKRAGVLTPIRRPKGAQGKARLRWLWPEEAERLFEEAARVNRDLAALLIFLTYTGLRLGEALSLHVGDLRLDEQTAYLPRTKNGEDRQVHLPPFVVATLSGVTPQPSGRLFRFTRGSALYKLLRQASEPAGVPWVGFHTLRHTWATWMRRYAGLDTRGLMGTGAWKDAKSAARYAHTVTTDEARKADLLPTPRARSVG
jgi:integrase